MTLGRFVSTEFIDKYMNEALMAMIGGHEAEWLIFMRWMIGKILSPDRSTARHCHSILPLRMNE